MNMTMAPTDQIRSDSLRRRHDVIQSLGLRLSGRDTDHADGRRRRDCGTGVNANGRRDGNDNGSGNGDSNNEPTPPLTGSGPAPINQGRTDGNSAPTVTAIPPPSAAAALSSAIPTITAIPFITTTPAIPPPTPTSASSTPSGIPMLTIWPLPLSLDTSSEPRKGLGTDADSSTSTDFPFSSSLPSPTQTPSIMSTATLQPGYTSSTTSQTRTATPIAQDHGNHHSDNNNRGHQNGGNGVSPLAERLLIAIGVVGAFVIIIAAVYLLMRMRKKPYGGRMSLFRDHKFERGGKRGWYGWRSQEADYREYPPPQYSPESVEEKSMHNQMDGSSYAPKGMPAPVSTPVTQPLAEKNGRESLLQGAAPFGGLPEKSPLVSTTESFFKPTARQASVSRQPSNVQRNVRTQSSYIARQPSNSHNNSTFQSGRTSNIYDPNQREVNHLSSLSSLSSGFGDGLIIPEPTTAADRQSRTGRGGRFSWMSSQPRDTVYTTSSVDTAPRFRSVNSWVAQQSDRVERHPGSGNDVPSMPVVPQMRPANAMPIAQAPTVPFHQRNRSDDPRFNFHPGQEVEISRGSRVPSTILDKKIGVN